MNQTFYPDVASTAQHAADLASVLAATGHDVTVYCSARAYDNPEVHYPRAETWRRVAIERLPGLGLGKQRPFRRIFETAFFLSGCSLRLLLNRRFDAVIAMTSPPFVFVLAAIFSRLRHVPLVFWVMDLNPDQAVAAGWLRPSSPTCRFLEAGLRFTLRTSRNVIALDRFMRDRLAAKGVSPDKISVVPPWSHDSVVRYDAKGRNEFRRRHGLSEKYVVMYSGNHSPCHPLDSILEAAERLRNDESVVFCFVGGGNEYARLKGVAAERDLANVRFLPYQPLEGLGSSLSSADLHIVALGAPFVGIVHPCKVYNILQLGIPMLYIGPAASHVGDLLACGGAQRWAHSVGPGEVNRVVQAIEAARNTCGAVPNESERRVANEFSQAALMPKMVSIVTSLRPERAHQTWVPVERYARNAVGADHTIRDTAAPEES